MSFRFVHAADLHLDTPFDRVRTLPAGLRDVVRDASLIAFDRLVDLAVARDAAFVLLAGGIYDGDERGLRAQLRLGAGLERLSARGIQTFLAAGGDDSPRDWPTITSWPSGVTLFTEAGGGGGAAAVSMQRDGVRLATVHGVGVVRGAARDSLEPFHREPVEGFHLGLLPGAADPALTVAVDELAARGLDYWALGGAPDCRILATAPWIVVPGTIQGRGFRPADLGPKGVLIVTVDGDVVGEPEFVPLDAVRCLRLDLDVSATPDLPALKAALIARGEDLRRDNPGPELLVRAALTGAGTVHRDLLRSGALDALLGELRGAAGGTDSSLWWDAIEDRTRPPHDRSEVRRRGDLAAAAVERADELAADPARLLSVAGTAFAPLAPVLPGASTPLEPAALAGLLDDAAALAVDLLEEPDRR